MFESLCTHLPGRFRPSDEVPNELIGATVVGFGAVDAAYLEENGIEGGVAIDYLLLNGTRKRLVFGFNEVAMWIADGPFLLPNPASATRLGDEPMG